VKTPKLKPHRYVAFFWALATIAVSACSGANVGSGGIAGFSLKPSVAATCGPPPPVPFQPLWLSYPEPRARAVSQEVKELVFAGWDTTFFGKDTVNLVRLNDGQPVAILKFRTFVPAPSPLPSPHATPPGGSGDIPYIAVNVPNLKRATRYVVSYTFDDWGDKPPSCRTRVTRKLGAFTTRS